MNFFEVCKMLVSTDAFHKDGTPHVMVSSVDFYTQENPVAVEFDYDRVFKREDKYHDVVGFYHTHPSGLNRMSQIDIETMNQWVRCLGKSLICVIETEEKINGWLFSKDGDKISYREVHVSSTNDVNYDIWLDAESPFWNPADFLLEGEYLAVEGQPSEEDVIEIMMEKLDVLDQKIERLGTSFNALLDALKKVIK